MTVSVLFARAGKLRVSRSCRNEIRITITSARSWWRRPGSASRGFAHSCASFAAENTRWKLNVPLQGDPSLHQRLCTGAPRRGKKIKTALRPRAESSGRQTAFCPPQTHNFLMLAGRGINRPLGGSVRLKLRRPGVVGHKNKSIRDGRRAARPAARVGRQKKKKTFSRL